MIRLPIPRKFVEHARKKSEEFDAQKTHDKMQCNNNYLGLLGEMMFRKWLVEQQIPFEWEEFVKQGWNDPDFIINGKGIDVKCTFATKMYVQDAKFDYYVFSRVNDNLKEWFLISFIKKTKLSRIIREGDCDTRKRDNGGTDYLIGINQMTDINKFKDMIL